MQYAGGKTRLAKRLADYIVADLLADRTRHYVEPFCGAMSVAAEVASRLRGSGRIFMLYDNNPHVVAMWQAALDGWEPPANVDAGMYAAARREELSSPEIGFILGGCSFGGKWGGGFARSAKRSIPAESRALVLRRVAALRGVIAEVRCKDFADIPRVALLGAVVYADPPYAGTMQPYFSKTFDSPAFWAWAQATPADSVLVSEFSAPAEVCEVCAWESAATLAAGVNGSGKARRVEKLFRVR